MYMRPWQSNVQQSLLLRYICHLMIVACVGADEDIQHDLPVFPLHPPTQQGGNQFVQEVGQKLQSASYWSWLARQAGGAKQKVLGPAWSLVYLVFWQCHVVIPQKVSQSYCGSTNSQSGSKNSASSKPPKTSLGSRTPVQRKSSERTLYCIYRLQLSKVALDSPSWTFAVSQKHSN